jgi:hypothetical protein
LDTNDWAVYLNVRDVSLVVQQVKQTSVSENTVGPEKWAVTIASRIPDTEAVENECGTKLHPLDKVEFTSQERDFDRQCILGVMAYGIAE